MFRAYVMLNYADNHGIVLINSLAHESVVLFHSTDGFDKCSDPDLRRLILQNFAVINC